MREAPEAPRRRSELYDGLATEAEGRLAEGNAHPDPDTLFAYLEGGLDAETEEGLRDHLAACRECAALLLELEPLAASGSGGETDETPADLALEASWRQVRREIRDAEESGGTGPAAGDAGDGSGEPRRRSASYLRPLAAVLAVAVLGLGLWALELRRSLDRLGSPQVDLPVLYLEEPVRAAGEPPRSTLAVPEDAARFEVVVTVPPVPAFPEYAVVLETAGGETVWRGSGLHPTPEGVLRLLLPSSMAPPGDYALHVAGIADGEPREVAAYRFALERGDDGGTG